MPKPRYATTFFYYDFQATITMGIIPTTDSCREQAWLESLRSEYAFVCSVSTSSQLVRSSTTQDRVRNRIAKILNNAVGFFTKLENTVVLKK